MSGSGGGRDDSSPRMVSGRPNSGDGNGSGGGDQGNDTCAINQQAPLNSPRAGVVETLEVGDILNVVLNTTSARPVLEVHAHNGIAGALTHTGHMTIIECIRIGNSYVARVVSRSGAAVTLQVTRA